MLRDVTIKSVLNGWIVRVGCQTLVFNDAVVMLDEIHDYLNDPDETEKKYRESAVNAKHTFQAVEVEAQPLLWSTQDGTAWASTDVQTEDTPEIHT